MTWEYRMLDIKWSGGCSNNGHTLTTCTCIHLCHNYNQQCQGCYEGLRVIFLCFIRKPSLQFAYCHLYLNLTKIRSFDQLP